MYSNMMLQNAGNRLDLSYCDSRSLQWPHRVALECYIWPSSKAKARCNGCMPLLTCRAGWVPADIIQPLHVCRYAIGWCRRQLEVEKVRSYYLRVGDISIMRAAAFQSVGLQSSLWITQRAQSSSHCYSRVLPNICMEKSANEDPFLIQEHDVSYKSRDRLRTDLF